MNLSRFYDLSWTGTYHLTAIYTIKTGSRKWEDLKVENVKFTLKSKVKVTKPVDENEEKESDVSDKEPEKQEPEKQEQEKQEKQEKAVPPEIPKDEKPEKIEKKEEPVEEAFPWYLVAIGEAVIIGLLALIIFKRVKG
jgi:outer membrane biosynthesis protein TonB